MKILLTLLFCPLLGFAQSGELEVIKAVASLNFAKNLDHAQNGELWGYHSGKIGIPSASSTLKDQGANTYNISNTHDLDLRTAWIEGKRGYGIGETISFKMDYSSDAGYAKVYNFAGVIELFNGYCKSEKVWNENSRIKTLMLTLNDTPVCLIELVDTWQYQSIDLRKLFKEPRKFPNAEFEITHNDVLNFKIMEVYEGTKYKDTALSELVFSNIISN
ncbi:MAG: hypothetical protein ABJH98_09245 [Reichenbachiella sp.]|uniref:NADase-type glycan-binding domain-containing protein n=1 Tax=Reichenbachiella sp. TaxID=2184521 RepID=UPI003298DA36